MGNSNIIGTIINLINGIVKDKDLYASIDIPLSETTQEPDIKTTEDQIMKIILTHTSFTPEGIFGKLEDANGGHICYTLEHSYNNKPKLANGLYTCIRGPHRLHNMTEDFITFEIKGIPDFDGKSVSGVLFHWGNFDKDSQGCVLLGSTENSTMIGNSRITFANFMKLLDGKDSFELEVL